MNTSRKKSSVRSNRSQVLYKMLYIVAFNKKVFEWLVVNEFLSNSINYFFSPYISIICFSILCIAYLFY